MTDETDKKEMSKKEQKETKGGRRKPGKPPTRPAPGIKPENVSWKTVDGAPDWSDQAAKDIGHDVENIG